ncbi:MAG: DUF503 domain-containing protein [Candidatus Aminicenantes bacterium]|jgi:uncharacterized protein YlxP (DUF503 family)|nr:DUF503 domain-containing protein [Candidatus Aminicenantes bacterium]
MIIGLIVLDLHLPHARSLKEKRMALNRIRDRIRQKFNAAYAELDFQDVWQRARLGIVTINSRKSVVEGQLQAVLKDVERTFEGETVVVEVQYF